MIFNAVNTKIRAMRSELFTAADYESLCRLGSVENVGARLKERPSYGSVLSGLEGADFRRKALEDRILLSLYGDYARIRLFFFDKPEREYLEAIFYRYKLNFIKLLLCMAFDERDVPYTLPEMDILLGRELRVDTAKLAGAKTVPAFIEGLGGTELHTILSYAYAKEPSLFALEQQLDLHYYLRLWKAQAKLPDKEDRKVMARINGTEADLRNIMWIYRLKRYYHVDGAHIYADLIPYGSRLTKDGIARMVECDAGSELLETVTAGPYGNVFTDFTNPEQVYTRAMRKLYRSETKKHPHSLAAAAGYIFDKEQEINNITSVLEGVRYQLPAGEIMGYVY